MLVLYKCINTHTSWHLWTIRTFNYRNNEYRVIEVASVHKCSRHMSGRIGSRASLLKLCSVRDVLRETGVRARPPGDGATRRGDEDDVGVQWEWLKLRKKL